MRRDVGNRGDRGWKDIVEVHLSSTAQIILASFTGLAALVRALALFLRAWRDKP